jgi:hypothetical protein
MPIFILAVLLFLGLIVVKVILLPSEVLTYFQVPVWVFWFTILSGLTWFLKD